jgi:hypothetical protein
VATDPSGNASVAPLDSFVTQSGPLDAAGVLPVGFWLSPAMPNPTRGGVRFALALPHDALVEVRVFDVSGRQVWCDLGRPTAAGNAQIEWPGRTAAGTPVRPGIYLAHVRTAGHRWIRRVVVIH